MVLYGVPQHQFRMAFECDGIVELMLEAEDHQELRL
jgi:hypothetical protein